MQDRYGRTRFGQSCLLARRLVENGVPFVQVNWSDHVEAEEDAGDGGWDHHYRNFQIMQDRHAPWLDQALLGAARRPAASAACWTRRWWWRWASSAGRRRSTTRPAATTGSTATAPWSPAAACAAAASSAPATPAANARTTGPLTPADLAATVHHCVGITSEQAQTLGIAVDGKAIEELF